ncbi:MAG: GtrA family protein [Bacteroidales bacterium]|nr:GtrA family protein [Bacteroidales bacterium]
MMISRFLQMGISRFLACVPGKFLRFLLVGCLNTAFGLGVYYLLIWLGLSYVWATLIAYILGVLFNFLTTGTLVFENRDNRLLLRFVCCYVATYCLNIAANRGLQHVFDGNTYFSGTGATVVAALASFFLLKTFVYRNSFQKDAHTE